MSSVVISGDTSGSITLSSPAVAGSNTITLPAVTGTAVVSGQNSAITAATAQASTSGTSIDFTSIPSWVKRVTVMLNGVSTNGSSIVQIQLGAGSVTTSGYITGAQNFYANNAFQIASSTSGFLFSDGGATDARSGALILNLLGSNTWVGIGSATAIAANGAGTTTQGSIALSGTLDRVRITTVNGTDTFDAGSINILYE